ncbi:MAG: GntR family transcriptional regulator [Spirochaetaceae bacterium]|nr:GntR family transcriptional regulator [Spirochaetaceae bacterium]
MGTAEARGGPNKKARIYEVLRDRVVRGELKPQDYINEQALCRELGTSKTPVREALQLLARNRLVAIVPSKGCFVTSIGVDLIREVFEIREIYECAAARIAAGLPTRGDFEEILRDHDSYKLGDDEQLRRSLLSGYQIHERIVNASGNSLLSEYYGAILDHILRIRIYFMNRFDAKRLSETGEEHKKILRAIINGNADEAESTMRDHLRRSHENIDYLLLAKRKEK